LRARELSPSFSFFNRSFCALLYKVVVFFNLSFDCSLELLCSVVSLEDAKDLFSTCFDSLLDLTVEILSISAVDCDCSDELLISD
jgi:hypothetical protein